jgi:hypothetical protein
MPSIFSTLSAGVDYTGYKKSDSESGAHEVERVVSIKGGAGVASALDVLAGKPLTPAGVQTEVTDEELEFLKNHPVFQDQLKAGFLKIVEKKSAKIEKVVEDMNKDDTSAPLQEKDFDKKSKSKRVAGPAPKVGKVS